MPEPGARATLAPRTPPPPPPPPHWQTELERAGPRAEGISVVCSRFEEQLQHGDCVVWACNELCLVTGGAPCQCPVAAPREPISRQYPMRASSLPTKRARATTRTWGRRRVRACQCTESGRARPHRQSGGTWAGEGWRFPTPLSRGRLIMTGLDAAIEGFFGCKFVSIVCDRIAPWGPPATDAGKQIPLTRVTSSAAAAGTPQRRWVRSVLAQGWGL